MITIFCFDPKGDRKLVFTRRIHNKDDIKHLKNWVKTYELENECKLIRAILGENNLAVLDPDDDLVLPVEYATPKVITK